MDSKKWAEIYTKLGYTVIPIIRKEKRPSISGWNNRRSEEFDPTEFGPSSNIGIVLGDASEGLVDIDIDSSEALRIAHLFLPETDWVFGRASKPKSHYIYHCQPAEKTKKFAGKVAQGTIIECRGNGGQTVFPPSIHPSGEKIAFRTKLRGKPADAQWDQLLAACRLTATSVEISMNWKDGERHNTAMAVSGALLKAGVQFDDVQKAIKAICILAHDQEDEDRLRAASDTHANYRAGRRVSGWTDLRNLIGDESVEVIRSWFGLSKATSVPNFAAATNQAKPNDPFPPDSLNDHGNAVRTLRFCKDSIIYVPEHSSFFVWKDGFWLEDPGGHETTQKCIEAVDHHIREITQAVPYQSDHEKARRFLWSSKNHGKLKAQVELLKSLCRVPTSSLNNDDMLIGCQKGVIDLKTGNLITPDKSMHITKKMNVEYDATADCLAFKKLLSDMFDGDKRKIEFLQTFLGYGLTGLTNHQYFLVFVGPAASGKSTLVNIINEIMGDYSTSMMASTLFESKGDSNALYDLATLQDRRMTFAQEAQSGQRLNAALIKALTGEDEIKARLPYLAPEAFRPKAKVIMVANVRPELDTYDEGLRRRILVLEADRGVTTDKMDRDLFKKLRAEKAGILNFLLDGLKTFQAKGLEVPASIGKASKGLFQDKDDIQNYLDERTQQDPNRKTLKGDLYDDYRNWCAMDCITHRSSREFSRILRTRFGIDETRDGKGRYWKGIHLMSSPIGDDNCNRFREFPFADAASPSAANTASQSL